MRVFTALAVALAIGLATAVSPFASADPDGLERVAADNSFAHRAESRGGAPISDYAFPGVENERLATGLAGFTGTLALFAAGYGLAFALRRRRRAAPA